jgi:hypothetical protein
MPTHLRPSGIHAFSQRSLGVGEARLSAHGSGQIAHDDVAPSPGAARHLLRFNADAVPVDEALLALADLHPSKIVPRLQARSLFHAFGSLQSRGRLRRPGLAPTGGFLRSSSRLMRGTHGRDANFASRQPCQGHPHLTYSRGRFGKIGRGSTTGCWKSHAASPPSADPRRTDRSSGASTRRTLC